MVFFYDGSFKGTAITETVQCLSSILLVSPSSAASYVNGTLQDSGENYTQTAIGGNTILGDSSAAAVRNIQGPMQEFVLYPSDQSGTPQSGIETNINTFYNIY